MASAKEREVLTNVIDIYKEMPYLWQKEHKDYANKDMRSEAFKVILEIYKNYDEGATIKILKRKIENMRTTYAKELKKILGSKQTGAGSENIYKPSLWYYDLFSFLGSRTEPCRNVTHTLGDENLSSSDETSRNSGPQKRKKTLFQKQDQILHTAEKILTQNNEEWEIFGKAIGHQMKDLDKRQLTISQKIISDVIFYAKFNKLSEESHVVLTNEYRHNNNRYYYSPSALSSSYSSQSPYHHLQRSYSSLPSRPPSSNTQQQLYYSPQPSPSRSPSPYIQQAQPSPSRSPSPYIQQAQPSPSRSPSSYIEQAQPSPSRPPFSSYIQQAQTSPSRSPSSYIQQEQPPPSCPPSSSYIQQAQPSPSPPSSNTQQQIYYSSQPTPSDLPSSSYIRQAQPSPSRPPSPNTQQAQPSPSRPPFSNTQQAQYSSQRAPARASVPEKISVDCAEDFLEYFPENSLPPTNRVMEGSIKEFLIFNYNKK